MKFWEKIILAINILAIIPLVLVYFASITAPDSFPYLVPFTFFYPYLLILNSIFILVWLFVKWKMVFLPLIFIIIGFPLILRLVPVKAYLNKSDIDKTDFKILSYNVQLFGLYNWQERNKIKQNMFQFIEALEPDIACFQEYFWSSNNFFPTTDSLIEILQTPYHYKATATDSIKTQYFGIATFSKYPIINTGSIKFEKTHNLIIFTDIVLNEDTVRLFNCHLQSMYFSEENYEEINELNIEQMRKGQIKGIFPLLKKISKSSVRRSEQVRTLAEHIKQSPYPVIVCGDFNDNPFSYTYKLASKNLKDSYSNASKKAGYTWKRGIVAQRIDFILYPDSYLCTGHEVHHSNYSDHFPIVAYLRKLKK